ncbi:MAG: sigma-54 dependent transcriptional regulator, partial [Nitrospiraceae bacterium]|nr:sigma-54 dependent transcriptional regulator [Nitrospiraceae bacterium]
MTRSDLSPETTPLAHLLIVEDDYRMRLLMKSLLEKEGYTTTVTEDGRDAVSLIKERFFDIVLTDLKMPHLDGMEVLSVSREVNPDTPVIVTTGYATVDSAVEAMKKGAYDYVQKPFDPDELLLVVKRALDYRRLIDENIRLSVALESCAGEEFVGMSNGAVKTRKFAEKVAPFDSTVLIQGETGSGKELVARLIHRLSRRASHKFLAVNCAALTESLLEAELFGYEKGAFTGAAQMKRGLFEASDGGTLFLDEINNSSPSMQMKLLRVLQDGRIIRVGGVEQIDINVRVIAASNADLKSESEEGRFRKDLFYRINVVMIDIPPLRGRRDDIPLLATHFLDKYSRKFSKEIKGFSPEVMKILADYLWPGNVRELENAIEHAVIMAKSQKSISVESLPEEVRRKKHGNLPSPFTAVRL